MSKNFYATFETGETRCVASHSNGRADLFYDLSVLVEKYVKLPCGITDDGDTYHVDAETFLRFFAEFWITQTGWLSGVDDLLAGWASRAAGLVQNLTLQPTKWFDRMGKELPTRRYALDDPELEAMFMRRKERGEMTIVEGYRAVT